VGQVYLYWGPLSGSAYESGADVVIRGVAGQNQWFGENVSVLGDVDGDGWADLVASEFSHPEHATAYLFRGPFTGDLTTSEADAAIHWHSDEDGGHYIGSETAGDLNGDGLADLAVVLPTLDPFPRVYVEYGPIDGEVLLDDAGDFVEIGTSSSIELDPTGVGDVDGDGIDDLLVGNMLDSSRGTWNGAACLYAGPLVGPTDYLGGASAVIWGEKWNEVGGDVAGAGDCDGDGYRDVLVSIWGDQEVTGTALFSGPLAGEASVWEADTLFLRPFKDGNFIYSVVGPGDLDGDGRDDVAVGATYESVGAPYTGAIWVVVDPPAGTVDLAEDATLLAGEAWDETGVYLDPVGDLDGDGAPEFSAFTWGKARDGAFAFIVPGALWR
jgi:hypothetical protein